MLCAHPRLLTRMHARQIAAFLARAADIALALQASAGKPLKDFLRALEGHAEVAALRAEVEAFAAAFPMPGFDAAHIGV